MKASKVTTQQYACVDIDTDCPMRNRDLPAFDYNCVSGSLELINNMDCKQEVKDTPPFLSERALISSAVSQIPLYLSDRFSDVFFFFTDKHSEGEASEKKRRRGFSSCDWPRAGT